MEVSLKSPSIPFSFVPTVYDHGTLGHVYVTSTYNTGCIPPRLVLQGWAGWQFYGIWNGIKTPKNQWNTEYGIWNMDPPSPTVLVEIKRPHHLGCISFPPSSPSTPPIWKQNCLLHLISSLFPLQCRLISNKLIQLIVHETQRMRWISGSKLCYSSLPSILLQSLTHHG